MALRSALASFALLAGFAAAPSAPAQVPEVELKAAFVYNFVLFTEWPAATLPAGRPLTICADASGAQLGALRQLEGRTVGGHALSISADPAGRCHVVLYEHAADAGTGAAGTLTVCDGPSSTCRDAVITLLRDGDRVRFDVDASRARARGLSLSSKLLRLAREVR